MDMLKTSNAIADLDDALSDLAKLYQFRSLEERLYGGLTVSQSYCLRDLYFKGPRTMSELAALLGVRLSTMTGVVDQLEGKGLVERVDHPEDRRSLQVRLTPEGKKLYHSAHEAFLTHLAPLVEGRSAGERATILTFLADVTETIRGWRKRPHRKE
jgi:MarR family transcriptional regulator, 2-MHQ and catechol-resistance regulon repressor